MTYGLALSGGGARGAAHVGVLKALEEEGMLPDALAGTSAGSIVAGLFAAGLSVKELEQLVLDLSTHGKSYMDPDVTGLMRLLPQLIGRKEISLSGLLKGKRLERLICELTGGLDISQVSKRLVIPAVDLKSGNTIAFTNGKTTKEAEHVTWVKNGSLCRIIMASSSVPAVFQPVNMEGYCLVDGGVGTNLPVDLLIKTGVDRVIGVDIGAVYQGIDQECITEVVTHSFSVMSRDLKDCMSSGELLLLKPPLKRDAGLFSFSTMPESLEQGYTYTKRMMPRIKKVLEHAFE